ncbi:MAG TPA: hypothetical protein PKE47_01870 [Verrucomicrobiota bacterium]|nr:hypothetical protein [Verrucomicrobiota bacterium]
MAVVLFVFLNGHRWIERTSESGGLAHNLVWLARLMIGTLFQTPWGLLGTLVGAGLGWLMRPSCARASPEPSPHE